ncbi:transposable element Tcb1 transposase [Trichonephila clavipes]|nr:transposable element Tcb1 transposase [Trichonephila clavipes]
MRMQMSGTKRHRRQKNHLDDFTHGRTIGKLKEWRSLTSVTEEFGINKSDILCVLISFCRRKESDTSRQAPFFSNCAQQQDESSFTATSDSQRQLISREVGTRFYFNNITERDRCGVWGGIVLNGWNELHVFDRSSVTGERYCKEMIFPHVRLFLAAITQDFVFRNDNARKYRTADVQQLLES